MHALLCFLLRELQAREFYGEPEPEPEPELVKGMNDCSPVMMLELGSGSKLRLVEWFTLF